MKKRLFFFIFILLFTEIKSQNIYDTFDNSNCSGNNFQGAFEDNINSLSGNDCLPFWNATHGTPNIFNNNSYIYPGSFNNFIDLKSKLISKTCLNMFYLGNGDPYSDDTYGCEGAYREFKFTKDKCYRITFNVSISGNKVSNDKFYLKMWAARNLPIAPKCCISLYKIPVVSSSDKETISNYDFTNVAFNSSTFTVFQQVEVFYRPSNDNFNEFWIYPDQVYTPGDQAVSIYAITDFKIEESCAQSINLNTASVFYNGNFKASETISIGSQTPSVNFSLIQSTELTAGNYIEFLPNTELLKNSTNQYLSAYIQSCTVLNSACSNSNTVVSNNSNDTQLQLKNNNILSENTVLISPNPTTGDLNISLNGKIEDEVEIELYNLSGIKIIRNVGIKNNFQIDISRIPVGLYIMSVKYQGNLFTHKVNKL